MAYVKPQVLVYQEFANTMTSQDTALRPWIVGRLADIHKRGEAVVTEDYWEVKDDGVDMPMPELKEGSTVDKESVKVYADNAILRYAEVEIPKTDITDQTRYAHSVSDRPNQIEVHNINLTSTWNADRTGDLFGNRDVMPDDIVRVTAYVADIPGVTKCRPVEFVSKIIGFIPNDGPGTVGDVARVTNPNSPTMSAEDGTVATTTTETVNGESQTVTKSYTGGAADDVYTIHIKGSTYSVTSASGKDSYPVSETLPVPTNSGTEENPAYTYTFKIGRDNFEYTSETFSAKLESGDTIKDVKLTSSAFTASAATFNDDLSKLPNTNVKFNFASKAGATSDLTYDPTLSGSINETFQVKVIAINNTDSCKNIELHVTSDSGYYDFYPQVTESATDSSVWEFNLIEVYDEDTDTTSVIKCTLSEANRVQLRLGDMWVVTLHGAYDPTALTVGSIYNGDVDDTYIVKCISGGTVGDTPGKAKVSIRTRSGSEYKECPVTTDTITSAFGTTFSFSAGDIALGETWIIQVTTDKDGPYKGIILRDSIPQVLRTVGDVEKPLNLDFCVLRDIEIDQNDISGGTNWSINNDNYIHLDDNIHITLPEFKTTTKEPKPLDLLDGTVSVAYREWLIDGAEKFNYVHDLTDIDAMPGPLEPENPLKYGVYKALANSGWHTVVYTTVTGDTLDDWNSAISVGSGSREIYTVVPLTQDLSILKLVETLVTSDSNEETCAWKNCFLSIAAPISRMLVGKSDNTLHPTSTDKKEVYAKLSSIDEYTGYVEIVSKEETTGLSNVDLSSVRPGDTLRVYTDLDFFKAFTILSASGDTMTIKISSVDDIPSEDALEVQVWHQLTRSEQVDYITDVAQSFANRRIKLVWPDIVGEAGQELPGTFLCAALAGLVGGSIPNQGLTRVTISGFDDMSRAVPYFTEAQIKQLASSGVWIVMEDLDGTIFTMHGLTTSTTSLQYSEEMITRIVDFMSLELRNILERYIGVTNVTESTMNTIKNELVSYMGSATSDLYSANGPLITAYEILDISQDALLKDRINIILSITVPKATNNIVLRIQAE